MPGGIELAKAYVQIIPSTQGIKAKLDEALGGEVKAAGDKAGGTLGEAMGEGLKKAGALLAAAGAAAGTAAAAVVKSAVDAYANFEQLTGGVETLFGTAGKSIEQYAEETGQYIDDAMRDYAKLSAAENTVMRNAQKAWSTAGMSANDYMETAIQSAAAMINSLDGDTMKAAELMDMSITDMADNVNKMGTSMESVQNAYRGFSRGNFTMLDNLALGFAGTKDGMQELLDKAQEFSHIEYDISSYSDIVEAIHVVQTEMGITGTTAKEASETISGSIASAKAAWQNLLTGLADENADLDQLLDDLVGAAETALGNLEPVIERGLGGIASAIGTLGPQIAEKLPKLVTDLAPDLIQAGGGIVSALGQAMLDSGPALIDTAFEVVGILMDGMSDTESIRKITQGALDLTLHLAEKISEALPELIPAAVGMIVEIVDTLTQPENIDKTLEAAEAILEGLGKGLIDSIQILTDRAPEIIERVATELTKPERLKELWDAGERLTQELSDGLVGNTTDLQFSVEDVVRMITGPVGALPDWAYQVGQNILNQLIAGIRDKIAQGWENIFSGNIGAGATWWKSSEPGPAEVYTRGPAETTGRTGGDTTNIQEFNVVLDASNVKEFNDVVDLATESKRRARMGGRP